MKVAALCTLVVLFICLLLFAPRMSAQDTSGPSITGYTTADYDSFSNIVHGYSETDLDYGLECYYDAYVYATVKDPNGAILISGAYHDTWGSGVASVDLYVSGSPSTTYTVSGLHRAVAGLNDTDYAYPYRRFWYDTYYFSYLENQGIAQPWYWTFFGNGLRNTHVYHPNLNLGTTYDSDFVTTPSITISGPHDLWWFAGATNVPNYPTQVVLTTNITNARSYKWTVQSQGQTVYNVTSANQLTLISTDKSSQPGDVSVKVTVNGKTSGAFYLTQRAPHYVSLVPGYPLDADNGTTGWVTDYRYDIYDQFNTKLPYDVPVNESFANQVDDYASQDWGPFAVHNGMASSGTFQDHFSPPGPVSADNPQPLGPSSGLSSTKVHHATQFYGIGSIQTGQGRDVSYQTLQFYLTHARQLDIVTPAAP